VARHQDDWGLLQIANAFEQAGDRARVWPACA
jgi:Asp-tRNA(Asn)/Glu-tRNA(Gln) amidotransferase A subunit family amidase